MNELLAQFVSEGRDLLRDAGEDLLALERAPGNEDAINRLFRSVHTLKGSSGLFDARPLTKLLHAAEDIFQAVREHEIALTSDMVDLTLETLDQVGHLIDTLEQKERLSSDAGPIADALAARLRVSFGWATAGPPSGPTVGASPDPAVRPPDLSRWFSDEALNAADGSINLISYLPEEGCFFKGEDPLHLAMQVPGLMALGTEARTPWPPLADLDPFTCNIGFHALSTAGRPELDVMFRCVPDQVTITELTASSLVRSGDRDAPASSLPEVVRALLRDQIGLLKATAPAEEFTGRLTAALQVAANSLRFADRSGAATVLGTVGAEALALRRTEPLVAAIGDILGPEAAPVQELDDDASCGQAKQPAATDPADRAPSRTLRVDQEKIDALMNLVGELVVAKNGLPFLARRAEQHYGLRELGREIKDQYGVIDRIAQELQGAVMAVRMMPVGQVFQRFPRLVRDLSRKLGKQVDLVIEGEETEADKNVIESLFDPLLHMVRNSLDHGVETPEDRVACGKPSVATVKLLARHDADQVVIEVVDDGRGIDPEAVKRKAYERGMLDETQLATIGDHDATMLIFAAGFSTAETVSDVSGRGVGLDVVRNAVERAGGHIAITSVKGSGTTVRLDLPLSMAVSRVMTVTLEDRLFGIPMDLIHGTMKVMRRDVIRLGGVEAFVLRDRVIPLVHLARLLDVPDEAGGADEFAVLVVRIEGQTIGIRISKFGEGMEVILKPLEGMLANIAGYAGTALLGDGRVLLVLDLKELMR
jgi:two-component system, chemotaxis family, sensor kinase CheA